MVSSILRIATTVLLAVGAVSASPMPEADAKVPLCTSFKCPTDNNKICVDGNGIQYKIFCSTSIEGLEQFPAKLKPRIYEPTFEDCLKECDKSTGCIAVDWTNAKLGHSCRVFGQVTKRDADATSMAAIAVKKN